MRCFDEMKIGGIRMSDALYLRVEAARCFRLARGPASLRLADELDALGRAFEQEAREVEARLLHTSAQQGTSVSEHYVEAGKMAEAV
jgi:hypothetical protein